MPRDKYTSHNLSGEMLLKAVEEMGGEQHDCHLLQETLSKLDLKSFPGIIKSEASVHQPPTSMASHL